MLCVGKSEKDCVRFGGDGFEEGDVWGQAVAWDMVSRHPFFAECYNSDDTLIRAMLAKLDRSF